MPETHWRLDGPTAQLQLDNLSLHFDAGLPQQGLADIRIADGTLKDAQLFGIVGPLPAVDSHILRDFHIRGDDLAATYETGEPDLAQFDIAWHAARPASGDSFIARVDLLVSIRTDRLDWRHNVSLESVVPATTAWQEIAPACDWFASGDSSWSLGTMVHAADLRCRETGAANSLPAIRHLRHRLFPTDSLERGVILRARARAVFFAGADADVARRSFAEFAAADPPLGS